MAPDAGVRFALGTQVRRFVAERNRIVAVDTSSGPIDADAFVLAAGTASGRLVKGLGWRLPVYPLKGYSLTLPVTGAAPRVSVTDFKRKVVYAPLETREGPRLRVAGMADIAGWSHEPDPVRLAQLVAEARAGFPRRGGLRRADRADGAVVRPAAGHAARFADPRALARAESLPQRGPRRARLDARARERSHRGGRARSAAFRNPAGRARLPGLAPARRENPRCDCSGA